MRAPFPVFNPDILSVMDDVRPLIPGRHCFLHPVLDHAALVMERQIFKQVLPLRFTEGYGLNGLKHIRLFQV